MFMPNLKGQLRRKTGRDIHGQAIYADPVTCPFGSFRLNRFTEHTDRRADSSASRGAADEIISDARILVPAFVPIGIDDLFTFQGQNYRVSGLHSRFTVSGDLDHIDVTLEITP